MSLVYIVDGYNVIKRSPLFRDKRLREARESFFSYLERYRPHGSLRNRLVIVFDGSGEVFGFRENHSFDVVFTSGGTADEKIKEMVVSSVHSKNIVVVTDDKELAFSVRRQGVKIMHTDEFLNKKGTIRADKGASWDILKKAELNIVQREAITEELARIWLKKK